MIFKKDDSGKKYKGIKAKIQWKSKNFDLAVLHAEDLNLPPITLRDGVLNKGTSVISVGYPGAADRSFEASDSSLVESTVTQGIVGRLLDASWIRDGEKFSIVQHSASVNTGNSGGPLIDSCGQVVGINTAKALGSIEGNLKSGLELNQSDGIFFASHTSTLVKELKNQGITFKLSKDDCVLLGSPSQSNSTQLSLQNSNFVLLMVGVSLLIGIGALYLALRKPNFVRETFTQFQRRSNVTSSAVIPTERTSFSCNLVGKNKNGESLKLKLEERILSRGGIVIGRDSTECDLVINETSVSRKHAKFTYSDNKLRIRDLNSKNGTWVDGKKLGLESVGCKKGQRITLGEINFVLEGHF